MLPLSGVVSDLVDGLAADEHAPGGGAVSAVTTALAAALVAKLARLSRPGWSEAGAAVAQAETLGARAELLAHEVASAYRAALEILATGGGGDQPIATALDRAADVPLRIVQTSADVAQLAATVAEAGLPDIAADAALAAALAEGAARGAAYLVASNLTAAPGDVRVADAAALAAVATRCRLRAEDAARLAPS